MSHCGRFALGNESRDSLTSENLLRQCKANKSKEMQEYTKNRGDAGEPGAGDNSVGRGLAWHA